MDGLIDFYGSMTDPLVFDRFKEADEEICFTRIYRTVDGQENQTVSSTTKCKEEVTMSIQEAVPGKKMLSCLVTICNQEDQAHRTLSMKEKTYNYFLQTMGLSKYVKFGCSNALSFDLVPQYQKGGQVSGFYASVFAKNFFGLFYIYNAEKNLSTGIFWSTEVIHPVFLKAVSSLQSLAYHRGFLLLAMAASINAFNQRHIETVRLQNAKIEARTGCNGWRNVERDTTDTSLSELSTQMSGFASSLITHRRSVKLCTEILTKVESIDVSNSIHGIAETAETRDIFESHISVIKRRAVVQSMLVELLLGRVQNQISAVSNIVWVTLYVVLNASALQLDESRGDRKKHFGCPRFPHDCPCQ